MVIKYKQINWLQLIIVYLERERYNSDKSLKLSKNFWDSKYDRIIESYLAANISKKQMWIICHPQAHANAIHYCAACGAGIVSQ